MLNFNTSFSIFLLLFFLLSPKNVFSEYLVLGKIKGWDCNDYVLMKSCRMLTLEAVKDGGKVYVLIFNLGFEKNDTKDSQEKRKKEVHDAMDALNVNDFHLVHDQPDNNRDLDATPLH